MRSIFARFHSLFVLVLIVFCFCLQASLSQEEEEDKSSSSISTSAETCSSSTACTTNDNNNDNVIKMSAPNQDLPYKQDGPEAKEIAEYLPYFPFKGIPRFYDIGGFLYEPKVFQKIVDIFVERYQTLDVDVIAGLDARGFILGPPIALALQKPFIMMRKKGKMPNSISSEDYKVEYGNRSGLTVQRDKIQKGQRVLIIDDLVATGGTLSSAISLVKMLGGVVVECACVVELKLFIDPPKESGLPSRTKTWEELGHADVPVWGLISEDVLTNEAELPKEYVDDGEEH